MDNPRDDYKSRWKIYLRRGGESLAPVFIPPDMPPLRRVTLGEARHAAIALFHQHGPDVTVELYEWYPLHDDEPALSADTECGEEYRFFTMGV